MLYALSGVTLGAAGVACLYSAWRRFFPAQRWLVPAGWLLLVSATVAWVNGVGAELGLAYALLVIPLAAWVAVLINLEIRKKKPRRQQSDETKVRPMSHTILQNFVLFLAAVPLAGVASILLSMALPQLLPWQDTNQLALPIFLLPVIWGLAAFWVCTAEKPVVQVVTLSVVGAASGLFLFG